MFVTTNPAIAKQADTQLAKTTINIICFRHNETKAEKAVSSQKDTQR